MRFEKLAKYLDSKLTKTRTRVPDVVIGETENPYLLRWFVIPRNRFFNIYHHVILRSDDDRALHDHPWWNVSFILDGPLFEHRPELDFRRIDIGQLCFRGAKTLHRLEVINPARTLFITGPRIREWGFQCPQGWRHWKIFTSFDETGDSTTIGRGCGEV